MSHCSNFFHSYMPLPLTSWETATNRILKCPFCPSYRWTPHVSLLLHHTPLPLLHHRAGAPRERLTKAHRWVATDSLEEDQPGRTDGHPMLLQRLHACPCRPLLARGCGSAQLGTTSMPSRCLRPRWVLTILDNILVLGSGGLV